MIRIATLLIIVFLVSCSSALYIPGAAQETASVTLSELKQGRKLYIAKCGSCHALVLPEKYKHHEWQQWMVKMAPKVAMDTAEKELILKYLVKGK